MSAATRTMEKEGFDIRYLFPKTGMQEGSIIDRTLRDDHQRTTPIMEKVLFAHIILTPLLFGLPTGQFLLSLIGSILIGGLTILIKRTNPQSRLAAVTTGMSLMAYSALMIQLLGGRIEAHFHIFAMITSMVIYREAWAMLAAAGFIAVHHVVFNFLQLYEVSLFGSPIIVFNYGCGIDIVMLHAAYVVLCVVMGLTILYRNNMQLFKMLEIQTELDQLNHSADETADLSEEVSKASNDNAQGASEQQSILEGTIGGFKDMNVMLLSSSKRAQDNFKEVEMVKERMNELDAAIHVVNESGKQIANILGTIETIAFQTNLLALNASVEAARAGEAGAGFSVVAEEVRALAKKTGEASKQIEELINSNVTNITTAGDKAQEVSAAFDNFKEVSSHVAETFNQIQHRTQEFESQLNEVASVSSRNVATAEETSGVAVQLSDQARKIRESIDAIIARYG